MLLKSIIKAEMYKFSKLHAVSVLLPCLFYYIYFLHIIFLGSNSYISESLIMQDGNVPAEHLFISDWGSVFLILTCFSQSIIIVMQEKQAGNFFRYRLLSMSFSYILHVKASVALIMNLLTTLVLMTFYISGMFTFSMIYSVDFSYYVNYNTLLYFFEYALLSLFCSLSAFLVTLILNNAWTSLSFALLIWILSITLNFIGLSYLTPFTLVNQVFGLIGFFEGNNQLTVEMTFYQLLLMVVVFVIALRLFNKRYMP